MSENAKMTQIDALRARVKELEAAADAAPEPEPEPAPEPAPAEHPWDASSSYITLKAACRARGLAAAGNAATLARRLARHDGGG